MVCSNKKTVNKCIPELKDYKNCVMSDQMEELNSKIIRLSLKSLSFYLIKNCYKILKKYSVKSCVKKLKETAKLAN